MTLAAAVKSIVALCRGLWLLDSVPYMLAHRRYCLNAPSLGFIPFPALFVSGRLLCSAVSALASFAILPPFRLRARLGKGGVFISNVLRRSRCGGFAGRRGTSSDVLVVASAGLLFPPPPNPPRLMPSG